MICDKCGATIGPNEASCSYCGNTVYENAEKEYFKDLESIREDMEELEMMPQNFNQKGFQKIFQFMFAIAVIFIVFVMIYMIMIFAKFGSLIW